ncbi:MAG: hypothetical protein ACLQDY_22220 [Streptosporangiaceae bacterium]
MEEVTIRQARELLIEYSAMARTRDERVQLAYRSGVSKAEIARLTGVARTTVDRIIDAAGDLVPDGPAAAQEGARQS